MTFLFFLIWGFSQKSHSSQIYMNNPLSSASNVQRALESAYSFGSGVGVKEGSCLLCHNTSSGINGQINLGYGQDFLEAAQRLGVPSQGGGSQDQATLELIFRETVFANQDSDLDGMNNAQEYVLNSDPASDMFDINQTRGGGGCGLIDPGETTSPLSFFYLLLLGLPIILILWRRVRHHSL